MTTRDALRAALDAEVPAFLGMIMGSAVLDKLTDAILGDLEADCGTPEPSEGLPADLRALSEAATPGPWEVRWPPEQDGVYVCWGTGWAIPHGASGTQSNMELVAAAVNYVRAALAETPGETR